MTASRVRRRSFTIAPSAQQIREAVDSRAPGITNYLGVTVVTDAALAETVLKDTDTFSTEVFPALRSERWTRGPLAELRRIYEHSIFFSTGDTHAALRALAAPPFRGALARDRRVDLRQQAEQLAASLPRQFDLVRDFADPFTYGVICDLIGIPEHHRPLVKKRVDIALEHLTNPLTFRPGVTTLDFARASRELHDYFRTHVLRVRTGRLPAAPVMEPLLAQSSSSASAVGDEQIVDYLVALLYAGTETTRSAIGNAAYAVLSRPDQLAAVRRGEVSIRQVAQESLRYDPPVRLVYRRATKDIELGGLTIKAGDRVHVSLAAAGRTTTGERLDHFDAGRSDGTMRQSFGGGIHRCPGAEQAFAELETALDVLFAMDLELMDGARRHGGNQFGSFTSLPVTGKEGSIDWPTTAAIGPESAVPGSCPFPSGALVG